MEDELERLKKEIDFEYSTFKSVPSSIVFKGILGLDLESLMSILEYAIGKLQKGTFLRDLVEKSLFYGNLGCLPMEDYSELIRITEKVIPETRLLVTRNYRGPYREKMRDFLKIELGGVWCDEGKEWRLFAVPSLTTTTINNIHTYQIVTIKSAREDKVTKGFLEVLMLKDDRILCFDPTHPERLVKWLVYYGGGEKREIYEKGRSLLWRNGG